MENNHEIDDIKAVLLAHQVALRWIVQNGPAQTRAQLTLASTTGEALLLAQPLTDSQIQIVQQTLTQLLKPPPSAR